VVDKDRSPSWSPARHDDLPADRVAAAFAYQPEPELW